MCGFVRLEICWFVVRGNPASWVWDETKIEPREEDMWLGFVWEDLQIRLWFRSEMVGTVERVFLPREAGPFPPFLLELKENATQ